MNDQEILDTNAHIPTHEIHIDIRDTEREIQQLEAKKVLIPRLSTGYNSLIKKRQVFIKQLEYILELRRKKEQ